MCAYRLILLAGLIGQLNCNLIKGSFEELKEPIVKPLRPSGKHDEFWLEQFLYILFNYSTLLIPILSVVYLVRKNLLYLPGMPFKSEQIF